MKKLVGLLGLVLALQVSAVPAFATGDPTVTVTNVAGVAGDEVTVDVVLSNCANFLNIDLEFEYDQTALDLVACTKGDHSAQLQKAQTYDAYPYHFALYTDEIYAYNGTLVTLTFKILDGAEAKEYPITVDFYKGRNGNYVDGDNCNYTMDNMEDMNWLPLGLSYVDGSITVKDYALSATKVVGASNVTVDVTASAKTVSGTVVAAMYDGDKLVEVQYKDATEPLSFVFGQVGDDIKVMWWNNLNEMVPYCEPITPAA